MLTQQPIDFETERRISKFLDHETALLDARQFTQWIDLLTDDFTYQVPTPFTPDSPARTPWMDEALILDETKESLKNLWAIRYTPDLVEFAWGENPPQRVRRFVSGLRISSTEQPGLYLAESNLLLTFVERSDPAVLVPAGRVDRIREVDGTFRLAARTVHLDQTVISTTHMRLVF